MATEHLKIRAKTVNPGFNQAFNYLADVFGARRIGGKISVWIDKPPQLGRWPAERQKTWANILDAVITVNVLAERGSIEMTRQQDYQGRGLGLFLDEKYLEIERVAAPA